MFVAAGLLVTFGAVWGLALVPLKIFPPCGFHAVTGHPCPTCGSTRMILALLRGGFLEAIQVNPFLFLIVAVLSVWIAAGAVSWMAGRTLTVSLSPREERWLWVALGAAFLANWAYMWLAGI
jgi:hypothetical protein